MPEGVQESPLRELKPRPGRDIGRLALAGFFQLKHYPAFTRFDRWVNERYPDLTST